MSRTPAPIDSDDLHTDPDDRVWWQDLANLDSGDDGRDPAPPERAATGLFAPFLDTDNGAVGAAADAPVPLASPERVAFPDIRGDRNPRKRGYTLEQAKEIADGLRALPAKDPSQLRLDKQAVVRHVADEIAALRKRGYGLEEVAGMLTAGGFEITTPTLKNYLQRARKADKEAAKARRAAMPLVLRGTMR